MALTLCFKITVFYINKGDRRSWSGFGPRITGKSGNDGFPYQKHLARFQKHRLRNKHISCRIVGQQCPLLTFAYKSTILSHTKLSSCFERV